MSTLGTFDAFTTARLGIYAAQLGLQVTGNNVANINTEGYTRQRINQLSFKAGAYDRYRSQLDNHVGSGALVMGINQIRDPYLDVRYRNTSATVGYSDSMLAGLQRIADILDEIGLGEDASDNEKGDGVLHAQLQDLADKLREYGKSPTKLNDTLVRNSAETLCYLLNSYADKLDKFYNETKTDFEDQLDIVNECLTNIRDLNREIRDCEIYGDNALELRDERNRQIDTLSEYLHIKVVYTEDDLGTGQKVEKLSIYLDDDNPDILVNTDSSLLIDGVFGAQLSSPEKMLVRNPKYGVDGDPLKDYLYKTVLQPGEVDPRVDPPTDPPTTLTTSLDWGTNDPEKATTVDNNIFAVEISKLIDVNKNEWSRVIGSTEKGPLNKAEVEGLGGKIPVKAVYSSQYTPKNDWSAGDPTANPPEPADQFVIGGKTFTIGKDISEDAANEPETMLAFIAAQMNLDPKSGYRVSVDKDTLVFTAKQFGAVAAENVPNIQVINDPNDKLHFENVVRVTEGVDAVTPERPSVTNPVTGYETIYSYTLRNGEWYETATIKEHTQRVGLDDNDLYGRLQATRELLTEAGEFATEDMRDNIDEYATEKRGIPYYIKSLDLLAKQFADQYNKINVGYMQNEKGNYINANGTQLEIAGQPISSTEGLTKEQQEALDNANLTLDQWLENSSKLDGGAVKMGGVLFSNCNDNNDPSNITAGNISVSQGWSNGSIELIPTFKMLFPDGEGGRMEHSTQNDNAGHMLNMIEQSLVYDPSQIVAGAVSNKLFEGNFNDMFNNINTTLGKDIRETNISLNNSYTRRVETETQREGVSGVDLNDEAMNMMQYSKAMSAAMRLMTVIDESLDRLINNTAI